MCIAEGRHCLMCDSDNVAQDYFKKHIAQLEKSGQKLKYKEIKTIEEFFQE